EPSNENPPIWPRWFGQPTTATGFVKERDCENFATSPPIVGKRLVRLGHLVRVLALFDCVAAVIGGVHDLRRQLLPHRLLAAGLRIINKPPHRQRNAPVLPDLDRNLVSRSADAPRLHFQHRLDVVERLLESLERILLGPLLDEREGAVTNPFSDRL